MSVHQTKTGAWYILYRPSPGAMKQKKEWFGKGELNHLKALKRLRPYDLRHGFVTHALQSGEDLKSVSQIIGHSRPDTTLWEYQHVTGEQHRQVVRNVPGLLVETERE